MRIKLDDAIVELGRWRAGTHDAEDRLCRYVSSALTTVLHDDFSESPKRLEHLVYDLQLALSIAHSFLNRVCRRCSPGVDGRRVAAVVPKSRRRRRAK
jgi:hypothetical protein